MTLEEAEAALKEAPDAPLSEEEIDRLVERVTRGGSA